MNKIKLKIIDEKKDLLFADIQKVLQSHGLTKVAFSLRLRDEDCPGGYWKKVVVRSKKTGKFVTRLDWICP